MFEPSRTAAACLADAYARVVPVRRRAVRSDHGPPAAPDRAKGRRSEGGAR
jgi:hypothetical protein